MAKSMTRQHQLDVFGQAALIDSSKPVQGHLQGLRDADRGKLAGAFFGAVVAHLDSFGGLVLLRTSAHATDGHSDSQLIPVSRSIWGQYFAGTEPADRHPFTAPMLGAFTAMANAEMPPSASIAEFKASVACCFVFMPIL